MSLLCTTNDLPLIWGAWTTQGTHNHLLVKQVILSVAHIRLSTKGLSDCPLAPLRGYQSWDELCIDVFSNAQGLFWYVPRGSVKMMHQSRRVKPYECSQDAAKSLHTSLGLGPQLPQPLRVAQRLPLSWTCLFIRIFSLRKSLLSHIPFVFWFPIFELFFSTP